MCKYPTLMSAIKGVIDGEIDPYEFCFDGPAYLTIERECNPVLGEDLYDELEGEFTDRCYAFEEQYEDARTEEERDRFTYEFIEFLKTVYIE